MADNVMLLNNSARVIHVGGVMLVPGMPTEVPASALENDQVKSLMEAPVEENSSVMMIEEVPQDASPKSSVQEPNPPSTDAQSTKSGDSAEQSSATSAASKPAAASTTTAKPSATSTTKPSA